MAGRTSCTSGLAFEHVTAWRRAERGIPLLGRPERGRRGTSGGFALQPFGPDRPPRTLGTGIAQIPGVRVDIGLSRRTVRNSEMSVFVTRFAHDARIMDFFQLALRSTPRGDVLDGKQNGPVFFSLGEYPTSIQQHRASSDA